MLTIKRKNEKPEPVTIHSSKIRSGTLFDGTCTGNPKVKGPFLKTFNSIVILSDEDGDDWGPAFAERLTFDNYVELDGELEVWERGK